MLATDCWLRRRLGAALFGVALLFVGSFPTQAATVLYVVRHAETMGNLTHHHSAENDRTLSPNGRAQVARLTQQLAVIDLDEIITSPKQRALLTILPYLQQHHRRAVIWPELAECCWQSPRRGESGKLRRGRRIRLDGSFAPYFYLRRPRSASAFQFDMLSYADGMVIVQRAAAMIRDRFAGTGKHVLLVTHYHSGGRIIDLLTGHPATGAHKLANARIYRLVEVSDGRFVLKR